MFKEGLQLTNADRLIVVDGQYYAIYNYEATSGNTLPIVIAVDTVDALTNPGNAEVMTEEQFQDQTGHILMPLFNLSQLKLETADDPFSDLDTILANLDEDLEKKAKYYGSPWYLDDEVQKLFAYGAITGESITPYLSELSWWKNTTEHERDWIKLVYRNPEEAKNIISENYKNILLSTNQLQITGEGVDDLLKQLASDASSGKFGSPEQAGIKLNEIVSLLFDGVKRQMAGGIEAIHEDYRGYVGRINETKSGEGDAFTKIESYLGLEAAHAYRSSGKLAEYAGLLRADAESGTNTNAEMINDELQKAHDKLFPNYEGSKHSSWSASIYNTASTILGKTSLSRADKKEMDLISQSVGGDMSLFKAEVRKKYEDDPTYQERVLAGSTMAFNQALSGVYQRRGRM